MRADHPPMIYIAGPLGGPTPFDVRRNIENARDLGYLVAEQGGFPVIPHTNTGQFYGTLDEETLWIPGAMELLHRCDAIACLGHWTVSKGARAEVAWAKLVQMPMYEHPSAIGSMRVGLAELATWIEYLKGRQRDAYDYLHWPRSAGL